MMSFYIIRQESTPGYTQQEVSLVNLHQLCLDIRYDIGPPEGLIAASLVLSTQWLKVIIVE